MKFLNYLPILLKRTSFLNMKNLLLSFFIFFSLTGWGQNLVPNNSFEDTVSAPLGGVIEDATGWINCGLTPDYYNPAFGSDGFGFGVPNCFYTGYQNALDGNSFAGFGLTQIPEQSGEFIGVQLTQSLTIGTKYYVSAYISKSDQYPCATNNLCFKFFNSMYFSQGNTPPFDNFAHVRSTAIISDTLNWQLVGGSFIADSAYQYLVIGNFFNLVQTDTFNCAASDASYYYIDNVCVSSNTATCMVPTSINQLPLKATSTISVYPNPASNYIQVNNLAYSISYFVYNELGEICMNGKLKTGLNNIDVNSLSNGLYFFRTDTYTLKIIINHQNK